MMASLQAARQGARVTLFEHNPALGKKLAATGSGRCNITNEGVGAQKYTCASTTWLERIFAAFGVRDLQKTLLEIGVPIQATSDGWYYPLSNSAQTVVNAFESALLQAGVKIRLSSPVRSFTKKGRGFLVWHSIGEEARQDRYDRVVLAVGGKAHPALGSRGELFPLLEQSGHSVIPLRPALAPVLADLGELSPLQGMRLDAGASLWKGKECLASTAGNLIFTRWGLNGPAVMDLSHHISCRPGEKLILSLDLTHFIRDEFNNLLGRQRDSAMPLRIFLGAFYPPKIGDHYLRLAGLPVDIRFSNLDKASLGRLVRLLSASRLKVKGVRGFEYCQMSSGGVPVTEVDPLTLESCRVSGLYLAGETLDVVGPCGGYNLQFAFSSGALAGRSAASNSSTRRCENGSKKENQKEND